MNEFMQLSRKLWQKEPFIPPMAKGAESEKQETEGISQKGQQVILIYSI